MKNIGEVEICIDYEIGAPIYSKQLSNIIKITVNTLIS